MPCHSCAILAPINNAAEQYAQQVFNVLAPGATTLFQSFAGCWLAYKIIRHGILKPGITIDEFLRPLLVFSLVILVLRNHQLFWEYIYTPISQTTLNLLSTIIRVSNQGQPTNNLSGMLEVVEISILRVTDFCERVYGNAGWLNPIPLIAGIILLFPFLLLWAIFMVFTIEYLFKLLIVSSLSPLFIVASAFDKTRIYSAAALKVILQGALTVCISVISISVTLHAIDSATQTFHLVDGNLAATNRFGFFSTQFCSLFCLGLVSVLFQLKAPAIASNIVGSQDGAGVSGFIAGVPATIGAVWSSRAVRFAGKTTVELSKKAGSFASNSFDSFRDGLSLGSFGKSASQNGSGVSSNRYDSVRNKLRS